MDIVVEKASEALRNKQLKEGMARLARREGDQKKAQKLETEAQELQEKAQSFLEKIRVSSD